MLPPKVAQFQVVIVPCGLTVKTSIEESKKVYNTIEYIHKKLKIAGIRVKSDVRENYSPGYKFNDWELKGVPIRLEIGPKDVALNQTRSVQRYNGEIQSLSLEGIEKSVEEKLRNIQADMFKKAKEVRDSKMIRLETWDKFVQTLNDKCLVLAPWCETTPCEDSVKEQSSRMYLYFNTRSNLDEPADEKAPSMGAKTLCIPFEQPKDGVKATTKCFACDLKAKSYTLWGRSY